MKKIAKFAIFFIYTLFIANSILFAMWIAFYEKCSFDYCWENFKFLFCQWNTVGVIFELPWYPFILYPILVLGIEAAILFYPVLLWWRKKTFFRAWLVAMTGLLLPNYLYVFLHKGPRYELLFYSLLVMTSGYALAWLISFGIEKLWKKPGNIQKG